VTKKQLFIATASASDEPRFGGGISWTAPLWRAMATRSVSEGMCYGKSLAYASGYDDLAVSPQSGAVQLGSGNRETKVVRQGQRSESRCTEARWPAPRSPRSIGVIGFRKKNSNMDTCPRRAPDFSYFVQKESTP